MTGNPRSLFKYTGFSERLLELLCEGSIYYADPGAFNDPLDCRPVVVPDVPNVRLKQILAQLASRRLEKEIEVAMKKLRLRSKNAVERRRALTDSEVEQIVGEIEYQALVRRTRSLRRIFGARSLRPLRRNFGKVTTQGFCV